jgi:hypothetical protein
MQPIVLIANALIIGESTSFASSKNEFTAKIHSLGFSFA